MRFLLLAMALCVSGCGATRMARVSDNYEKSLESYKACVRAKGPAACTSEKAILDADAQRYQTYWAAGSGGTTSDGPAVYQPVGGGTVIRY